MFNYGKMFQKSLISSKEKKINFVLNAIQTKCLSAKGLLSQIQFLFYTLPQIYYLFLSG